MAATLPELLTDLAGTQHREAQLGIVFAHPILLAPNLADKLANSERLRFHAQLSELGDLRTLLENNASAYPIGPGPLERIWDQQTTGAISADHAEALARIPETAAQLSPLYARMLSRFTLQSAAIQGTWRPALALLRLLRAALSAAAPGAETEAMRRDADENWIEVVKVALCDVPDGRLYSSALQVGDDLRTRAMQTGDQAMLANVEHLLGILHLDPYASTKRTTGTNYAMEMQLWKLRLDAELGPDKALIDPKELAMPEPREALHRAEEHLRAAVQAATGFARGISLKALAQTLKWQQKALMQPIDRPELLRICREAMPLLEPGSGQRLYLQSIEADEGQQVDLSDVELALAPSPDELIRKHGYMPTVDLVVQAISILGRQAPMRSIAVSQMLCRIVSHYKDDERQRVFWQQHLNLLRFAWVPEVFATFKGGNLRAAADALERTARDNHWDATRLAAGLLALAQASTQHDREHEALELLERMARIAPLFVEENSAPLANFRAELWAGVGTNEFNARHLAAAAQAYGQSLRQFLDLQLSHGAIEIVKRLIDITQLGNALPEITFALATVALRLEALPGRPATASLLLLCKLVVAAAVGAGEPSEIIFLIWQIAKGMCFSVALTSGTRFRFDLDPRANELLQQIAEVEAEVEAARPSDLPALAADHEAILDENYLLAAYVRSERRQSGATPDERLLNLQQEFDGYIHERITSQAAQSGPDFIEVSTLRNALDARTVLANFYLGRGPQGNFVVYLQILTAEEKTAKVFSVGYADPDLQFAMGDGPRQVIADSAALFVEAARRAVQDPPDRGVASDEALEEFSARERGFLGNAVEYLDQLRAAGKDHLCVVPHGALHYYPLHLLGTPDRIMADRWIVSYLPSLYLLSPNRGPTVLAQRRRPLSALGIAYAPAHNPHGLPPLEHSARETQAVATPFGVRALLDDEVTKDSLREALQASRCVHLSVHGRHNVNAPAFQCLYLSPDGAGSDGRLYAHELLSLDLRGLELITLSACETALGRFDIADNVRGLPATLLLAGVSTLIGTLWEVNAKASEMFFTTFYECLHENGGERLDAFAVAQKKTREVFPEYRDWAPFYYVGAWA